jgi:hypothetical protein
MTDESENPDVQLPPLRLSPDEYLAELSVWRESADPERLEKAYDALRSLCPETYGEHGIVESAEEFATMFEALPSCFPVLNRIVDKTDTVGTVDLDWPEVFNTVLMPMRDLTARQFMAEYGYSEVVARYVAGIIALAQMDHMMRKMETIMSEAFGFLVQETLCDAVETVRVSEGQQPTMLREDLIKGISQRFEESLRHRNDPAVPPVGPSEITVYLDLGERSH